MAPGPAVRLAFLLGLLLLPAPLAAQAPLAPPRGPSEQFGEQLAGTQAFIERRWVAWTIKLVMQKIPRGSFMTELNAEAQRLGTRGPGAQDWANLNADLTREINAYLDWQESLVRSGKVRWPQERPRTTYQNHSLILIETIRADAMEAIAKRKDPLPAMIRAGALTNSLVGNQQFVNYFAGRDAAVDEAMHSVKMAAPRPPQR